MAHIDLKKNTNVGEYRHRIEVQRLHQSPEPDENGFTQEEWITYYSPRAKLSNMAGKEYTVKEVQPYSREVIRFWFRTHPKYEVTVKDRILYNNKYYDIKTADNVNDVGKITYLQCQLCE